MILSIMCYSPPSVEHLGPTTPQFTNLDLQPPDFKPDCASATVSTRQGHAFSTVGPSTRNCVQLEKLNTNIANTFYKWLKTTLCCRGWAESTFE